jgi:tryptophan-rich sensory protein
MILFVIILFFIFLFIIIGISAYLIFGENIFKKKFWIQEVDKEKDI